MNGRDARYMQLALDEAVKGRGTARPNPMVGCVIVRGDEVVGRGFHLRAGLAHAEVEALRRAGSAARGATAGCGLGESLHTILYAKARMRGLRAVALSDCVAGVLKHREEDG